MVNNYFTYMCTLYYMYMYIVSMYVRTCIILYVLLQISVPVSAAAVPGTRSRGSCTSSWNMVRET